MSSNIDVMERTTELRHVSNKYLIQLSNILNTLDSWKELMAAIPKRQISATEFDESTSQPKYKYSEIKEIELASRSMKQQPTLILFDEWGTSGQVRPTLTHLLTLLVRVELYRAADFVALEMLKETVPVRPVVGPAARVDISIDRTTIANTIPSAIGQQPSSVHNTLANKMQPDKIGPSAVQKVPQHKLVESVVKFTDNLGSNKNIDVPNNVFKPKPSTKLPQLISPPALTPVVEVHPQNIQPTNFAQSNNNQSIENYPKLEILNLGSQMQASAISGTNSSKSVSVLPDLPGLMHRSTTQSNSVQREVSSVHIPRFATLLETSTDSSEQIVASGESSLSHHVNSEPGTASQTIDQLSDVKSTIDESVVNIPLNLGLSGVSEQSEPVVPNKSGESAQVVVSSSGPAPSSELNIPFLSNLIP